MAATTLRYTDPVTRTPVTINRKYLFAAVDHSSAARRLESEIKGQWAKFDAEVVKAGQARDLRIGNLARAAQRTKISGK